MRRLVLATLGLIAATAAAARAELLQATRPGIMCQSPDALAQLSLPDGSSRTMARSPSPAVAAIARAGNCVDFSAGNVVVLVTRRANTSLVRSDTLTGDGVIETFIIPNIDYAPYVPTGDFADAIRARCATKLDEVIVRRTPTDYFVASLPQRTQDAIDKAIDDECGGAAPCSRHQRYVEVSKRHLVPQWAEFICRQH